MCKLVKFALKTISRGCSFFLTYLIIHNIVVITIVELSDTHSCTTVPTKTQPTEAHLTKT